MRTSLLRSWVLVLLGACGAQPQPSTPPDSTASAPPPGPMAAEPGPGPEQAPPASLPASVTAWWPEISAAAGRHGLPPVLVALVVSLESSGDPQARSPMGALGLMQLMPGTAAKVARDRGEPAPTEAELLDPARNLELGCALVASLLAEHGATTLDGDAVHRMAVAYNGGPKVLAAWQGGAPLPAETERYAAALRERWVAMGAR
jgi:soluble lytic murein transglycosylase-like protein